MGQKLSDASYPFLKGINWLSDIYVKPLPGTSVKDTLKAIDKAIVMGSNMDGNLLKAAAEAHHKAIGSIDANGVTSAADYAAVNTALAKAIASVPSSCLLTEISTCSTPMSTLLACHLVTSSLTGSSPTALVRGAGWLAGGRVSLMDHSNSCSAR